MRKEDVWTVSFAAIVCIVCSLLISAAAAALKERQDFNVEVDRKLNVLRAFGAETTHEDGSALSGSEVDELFSGHIAEVVIDATTGAVIDGMTADQITKEELKAGDKLPLYTWQDDGGPVTSYAFPLSGKGLWSTIYSYLALEADLSTIRGVTFYGHKETPGLGGEVSADWFMEQFKGKKIREEDGQLADFKIVKGKVQDRYPKGNDFAVDGMSGATMTGNGVEKFFNQFLQRYDVYFSKEMTGGANQEGASS